MLRRFKLLIRIPIEQQRNGQRANQKTLNHDLLVAVFVSRNSGLKLAAYYGDVGPRSRNRTEPQAAFARLLADIRQEIPGKVLISSARAIRIGFVDAWKQLLPAIRSKQYKGQRMTKLQLYTCPMLVWFTFSLVVGVNQASALENSAETNIQSSTRNTASNLDESPVRKSTNAFVKMFNSGDAKGIAAQWTENGDYVNEQGQRFVGREAIQKEYESFFAQYPGIQIQVKVDNVKMLTPDSAIVEGTSTLGAANAPSPVSSHFIAIHVKRNNRWLIVSAHDIRVKVASRAGKVADLAGLIGVWQFTKGTTTVEIDCRWIANKKFAERAFSVFENGSLTHSGKQIIGLDPVSQQITSWLFDSTGGHDVGVRTPQGKGWIVESTGVLADGTPTSAVNRLTAVDDDSFSWQSVNRTAGDQSLPDSSEVLVKRVSATDNRE